MRITKKCLPFMLILVLLATACNLLESPPVAPEETEPAPTEPPVTEEPTLEALESPPTGSEGIPADATTPNLTGTWVGTLTENSGTVRDMTLVLYQSPPYTEITGTLNFTAGTMSEDYEISGGIDGIDLRVETTGYNMRLTASYTAGSPETLTGNAAFDCYDCPGSAFGYFTLTRGTGSEGAPASTAIDLLGTWTGTAIETGGAMRTFNTILVIDYGSGTTYSGTIDINYPDGSYYMHYLLNITLSGSDVQMTDSGTEVVTKYFWGSVFENTFVGHISGEGFELNPFASFTLTR